MVCNIKKKKKKLGNRILIWVIVLEFLKGSKIRLRPNCVNNFNMFIISQMA